MKNSSSRFYKGIPGFTRENEEELWWEAERGIYGWWWRYLRLSPVFWFARTTGIAPKHPEIARVYAAVGDLQQGEFPHWWRATGASLFVEEARPRKTRVIDEENLGDFKLYPKGKSIVVEIPLTIRQGTIARQIREILSEHHLGRGLDVMAHSTAQWALHTKKFNLKTLEREYWALLYRMLYPDIAAWRVGDRLKLAPGLNLRDMDRWKFNRTTSPHTRMSSTIGRYLYKAQWTLWNAEQGTFPNAAKAVPVDKPFGARHHSEFLEAIGRRIDTIAPWHQWLHKEHHEDLAFRIRAKNNLPKLASFTPTMLERFPRFIAGESDLLL